MTALAELEAVIVTLPQGVGGGTQIAVTYDDQRHVDVLIRSHPSMAWERIGVLGGTFEVRTRV
jgi:hypothetical protein